MHKLFDKIFANRVQEVFSNHQEAYSPDDWRKLRAKMGQNKRGAIIFLPFVAKAASVVLFLGLSVFVANKYDNRRIADINGNTHDTKDASLNLTVKDTVADQTTNEINMAKSYDIGKNELNNQIIENEDNSDTLINLNNEIIVAHIDSSSTNNDSLDRFANLKNELIKHHQEIQDLDTSGKKSNKPVLLEDNAEFELAENKSLGKNRFGFGVELASISNYSSEGTGNGVNVGGGFSAAYKISKSISFTTGAIIAKQSVNYNKSGSHEMLYADYAPAPPRENTLAVIDLGDAKSEISFIAIDIPLNVQFKHHKISFTTGLSSLLYVQEKYSYSYNSTVTNTVYNKQTLSYDTNYTSETVNSEENADSFNSFDFARLLNFSVGYDIPLAKGNLVVEPYVKYPIGSVSFKEISMGSGGCALRYVF